MSIDGLANRCLKPLSQHSGRRQVNHACQHESLRLFFLVFGIGGIRTLGTVWVLTYETETRFFLEDYPPSFSKVGEQHFRLYLLLFCRNGHGGVRTHVRLHAYHVSNVAPLPLGYVSNCLIHWEGTPKGGSSQGFFQSDRLIRVAMDQFKATRAINDRFQ